MFENIRKFLTCILTSNIPEIVSYLAFVLFRIPLPLTVIHILAIDLGTDTLPAWRFPLFENPLLLAGLTLELPLILAIVYPPGATNSSAPCQLRSRFGCPHCLSLFCRASEKKRARNCCAWRQVVRVLS